jgi:hypothetical protein
MNNIYDFFLPIYNKYGMTAICDGLYLHKGTIKRWMEKKEVPPQYYFDLCRIDGVDVDYSLHSNKEKDQFFTDKNTARYCYDKAIEVIAPLCNLGDYTFIEPSAGDGSFYTLMPEDRRIGVDIEPQCDGVIQADFLQWKPDTEKNIMIGNPPFGLRGNLALKFINHAHEFADFVCFIVPQLFDSNGKGSCKSRVKGYNLIHSEVIDSSFYYPGGTDVEVNCVFQIWSRLHESTEERVNLDKIIKIYSLSDGGTPGSTRNQKHLYSCDYYLPSTCFKEMEVKTHFEDLPHRRGYGIVSLIDKQIMDSVMSEINWEEVSFKSTNGALNLRFDIIEKSIWDRLPVTVREQDTIACNPLLDALS